MYLSDSKGVRDNCIKALPSTATTASKVIHMASNVEFLMSDGRWAKLQEQVDSNDGGNSHSLMLDTYMRMVAEHRRIKASRDRGFHRKD